MSRLELSGSITSLSSAFKNSNITVLPNISIPSVTTMQTLCRRCIFLKSSAGFSNTENLLNTAGLMWNCTNLVSISNFDTYNVTNMSSMFMDCYSLTNIPNFSTSNVTKMSDMFNSCYKLDTVPNFDTSNVISMSNMFYGCINLTSIPELNTLNVTNMSKMFQYCHNLTTIPILNMTKVTDATSMFDKCENLSSDSYTKISNMLPLATNLTNQYLSNIGLNLNRFTDNQLNILNTKGYIDAIPPTPIEKLTYYNIYYNTLDEV